MPKNEIKILHKMIQNKKITTIKRIMVKIKIKNKIEKNNNFNLTTKKIKRIRTNYKK